MPSFRSKKPAGEESPEAQPAPMEDSVVLVERTLDPYLVSIHDPEGHFAEQIRGLRNKLTVMNPDGAARTLVLTSAGLGDGKTVTAINLAVSFAELEDTRVLLVDADLRKPGIEPALGMTPGPGLSDLLQGRMRLDQAIRPSGINGVELLGSGQRPGNPSEILASRRMDDLFAQLKEDYQYVLIDTPPVMLFTDASVLSAKADGTLFVVRMEHSPRNQVLQSVKTVQELGGNVLGTFLVGVRGTEPDDEGYREESAAS
jgi:succinoglycan biosynthesis transport protein ExoP